MFFYKLWRGECSANCMSSLREGPKQMCARPLCLFFGETSGRDCKGLKSVDSKSKSRVLTLQTESVLTMIIDVGVGDQEITFEYPSVSEETR